MSGQVIHENMSTMSPGGSTSENSELSKQDQKKHKKEKKDAVKTKKDQSKSLSNDSSPPTTPQDEGKKGKLSLAGAISSLFTIGSKKNPLPSETANIISSPIASQDNDAIRNASVKNENGSSNGNEQLATDYECIYADHEVEFMNEIQNLKRCPWFHYEMSRNDAALKMSQQLSRDGAFLVRCSERGGCQFPFVLCVNKDGELFNIQIGVRGRGPMVYALGSERLDELKFSSVPELIRIYHTHQLELFRDGRSAGFVTLSG